MENDVQAFLERKVEEYNRPSFIAADPVLIPHAFSKRQDIEIAGLFAAVFAWGNRTTIINKCRELMSLMDNQPYAFITGHAESDLKRMLQFRHRTFNATDLLYFIAFLRSHYAQSATLETAFFRMHATPSVEEALNHFFAYFFSLEDAPARTKKHVAAPWKRSTCKRLNMYLRWMVRHDDKGVDFGLWKRIAPTHLICPVDVHVARVARRFDLIQRTQTDWLTAVELTQNLKKFDPADPVKYDYALFSLGADERFR